MKTSSTFATFLTFAVALTAGTVKAEVVANVPQGDIEAIDFVEANGQQYLDTGVPGRSGTRIEADVVVSGNLPFLLAAKNTADNFFISWKVEGEYMYALYLPNYHDGWWGKVSVAMNSFYHFTSEISTAGAITGSFNNGATTEWHKTNYYSQYTSSTNAPLGAYDTGNTFFLFQCNCDGSPTPHANQWFVGRLKAMKIWQTSAYDSGDDYVLVRDFRPCRYQGRVGLYDAVSGAVYFSDKKDSAGNPVDLTAPANTQPDALLEYVKTTGSQFIDTGVIGRSGTRIKTKVAFSNRNTQMLLGSASDNSHSVAWGIEKASNSYFTLYYLPVPAGKKGAGGQSMWSPNKTYTSGITEIESEVSPVGTLSLALDDVAQTLMEWQTWNTTFPATALGSADTGLSMFLFARNKMNVPDRRPQATLYSLEIEQYDEDSGDYVTVRDYRPCVKNGKVGLYDAASGTIHYSICGDLVAGPVAPNSVKYVEWVEATGTQYVNTGVTGRNGTRIEADVVPTSSDNYSSLIGCSYQNNRHFLLQSYGSYLCFRYLPIPATFATKPGQDSYWYYPPNAIFTKDSRHVLVHDVTADGTARMSFNGILRDLLEWSNYRNGLHADSLGALNTGVPMYVFADRLKDGGVQNLGKYRLYGLKIWQDGKLVRDFRPCVVNEDLGAFRDEVTGGFFYSLNGNLVASTDEKPAIAAWRGASAPASAADLSNAANWTCHSPNGAEIAGAVPSEQTTVVISSENVALLSTPPALAPPVAPPLRWGSVFLAASQTLSADSDWTALDAVTLSAGVSIDLNGHSLRVASLGAASGVSGVQVTNGGAAASLTFAPGESAFVTVEGLSIGAGVTLVKEGAGTLETASVQLSGDLEIAAGRFVGNGLTTAGRVAVADGANVTGLVLSDGATLDVGGRTTALDVVPVQNTMKVSFAANATIAVDTGTRSFARNGGVGEKIIAWSAAPTDVTFTTNGRYLMEAREDGMYAVPPRGFILIVR